MTVTPSDISANPTSGQGGLASEESPVVTQCGVPESDLVTVTIDGSQVRVRKGTNIIEAARLLGKEIPHYCYHPDLSIAGNCRMCQIQVKGVPRLSIGCNTSATEGMEVTTQATDSGVVDGQASVLEFILANHPLDCTVCDQAGHCKLQDYHYEYNGRPSRFLEDKVHKVKAEPLGPTVMLDGERCIMCSRCVRFCDEITGTSEIGLLNRGDRTVIAVSPDRPLDNPLSGTVVDLCPVGALTHREWRFNSRIWFSKQTDAICPGCSTGCNVRVAVRDAHEVVQVKARYNQAVNKEWLCDEGRYGFGRFLPRDRLTSPSVGGKSVTLSEALRALPKSSEDEVAIFVAPDLILEEYIILRRFIQARMPRAFVALAFRERELTSVEKILISPDYAANFRGVQIGQLFRREEGGEAAGDGSLGEKFLGDRYEMALRKLRGGVFSRVFFIGERAIAGNDLDAEILSAVRACQTSLFIGTDETNPLVSAVSVVIPGRSILEKSGLVVNRAYHLQYTERVVELPEGTMPEWRVLNEWATISGGALVASQNDRELTLEILSSEERLKGLRLKDIKAGGVSLAT
jgi:NADH-quinone oxidoreductase subunit G